MDLEHTQLPEISTEHDSQRMDTDGAVLRDVRGAPKRLENVNEQRLDDECVEPEDVVVVDNGAQKPRRPRRRKPAARGGARRVLKRNAENRNAQSKSRGARITRARIVCHKRTGRWEIAVIPAPGVVVRGESERHSAGMRGEFAPHKISQCRADRIRGGRSGRAHTSMPGRANGVPAECRLAGYGPQGWRRGHRALYRHCASGMDAIGRRTCGARALCRL